MSLKKGEKYTNWFRVVKILIKTRNEYIARGLEEGDVKNTHIPSFIRTNPKTSYLIENNTRVRVRLDRPINIDGTKLKSQYDTGHSDVITKWSKNVYKIVESVLIPGNPPLYYVKREGRDKKGRKFKN